MILGHVDYMIGFIMAISMIVGSYVGARFAIAKGVGYIKLLFVTVTSMLILKIFLIMSEIGYKKNSTFFID